MITTMRKRLLSLRLILFIFCLLFTVSLSSSPENYKEDDCDTCYDFPADFDEQIKKIPDSKSNDYERITPPPGYSDVLVIFSAQNCSYCKTLVNSFIPDIALKYYKKFYIKVVYLNTPENYEKFYYLIQNKSITQKVLPIILSEKDMLVGSNDIDKRLEEFVKQDSRLIKLKIPSEAQIKKDISSQFDKMTSLVIVSAGLIDGINPCAFGTIIFLITYLSINKFKKRQILFSGLAFSLGVFTLYLLMGIGIYDVLSKVLIRNFGWLIYIKHLLAALMLLFFCLSIYDIFLFLKNKKSEDMILKLPENFRGIIHRFIRLYSKNSFSIILSFLLGFVISIIELACTGQVYFPTIMYLIKDHTYRLRAILYLLLYNLAFILPLIIVFMAVFFGISIKLVENQLRKNVWIIKILLALLFLSLFLIFLLK